MSPIPVDNLDNFVIKHGNTKYVLKPRDKNGISRLQLYRDGELNHGYSLNPTPRRIEHFAAVIEDSFRTEATFMNAILLVRFFAGRSLTIHNFSVIESNEVESNIRKLGDREELISEIEKHFEIPAEITAEALSEIKIFKDVWD